MVFVSFFFMCNFISASLNLLFVYANMSFLLLQAHMYWARDCEKILRSLELGMELHTCPSPPTCVLIILWKITFFLPFSPKKALSLIQKSDKCWISSLCLSDKLFFSDSKEGDCCPYMNIHKANTAPLLVRKIFGFQLSLDGFCLFIPIHWTNINLFLFTLFHSTSINWLPSYVQALWTLLCMWEFTRAEESISKCMKSEYLFIILWTGHMPKVKQEEMTLWMGGDVWSWKKYRTSITELFS